MKMLNTLVMHVKNVFGFGLSPAVAAAVPSHKRILSSASRLLIAASLLFGYATVAEHTYTASAQERANDFDQNLNNIFQTPQGEGAQALSQGIESAFSWLWYILRFIAIVLVIAGILAFKSNVGQALMSLAAALLLFFAPALVRLFAGLGQTAAGNGQGGF